MEIRGKNYSMINAVDEDLLVTPDNKLKKEDSIINKIFLLFLIVSFPIKSIWTSGYLLKNIFNALARTQTPFLSSKLPT